MAKSAKQCQKEPKLDFPMLQMVDFLFSLFCIIAYINGRVRYVMSLWHQMFEMEWEASIRLDRNPQNKL